MEDESRRAMRIEIASSWTVERQSQPECFLDFRLTGFLAFHHIEPKLVTPLNLKRVVV